MLNMAVAHSLQYSLPLLPSCSPLTYGSRIGTQSTGWNTTAAMSFLQSGYKRYGASTLGTLACSLDHPPWGKTAGMVRAVQGSKVHMVRNWNLLLTATGVNLKGDPSASQTFRLLQPWPTSRLQPKHTWSIITQLLLDSSPSETLGSWKCVVLSYQVMGYIHGYN